MKKFLKFAATLAAMFMVLSCFVACGGGSGAAVDTPAIDDVEKSGATTVVSTDEEIETLIASMKDDPAIKTIVDKISDLFKGSSGSFSSSVRSRQAYEKADSEKMGNIIDGYSKQIEKFSDDIENTGKGTLSIDDTITEVDLGDDFKWLSIKDVVLKINADVSVNSEGTGGSIKADAEVAAKTEIKPAELVTDSGFGNIKCNFNVVGNGKVEVSDKGENVSGKVSSESAIAIAFPYKDTAGVGGRFLITFDADASSDLAEAMKLKEQEEAMDYIKKNCNAELVIKVYDDDGKETYSKKMNLEDILEMFTVESVGSEEER